MMDAVQQTARLLSSTLFRRGRIMIAPPSAYSTSWRVFGGGLSVEVCEHEGGGLCSFVLRGPDGKTLRQGVAADLASALPRATDLLCQLYEGDHEAAA
ncbi:MAG TPA: hypothetical protein VJN48_17515 [Terriglobales bacterium]|nr:hypothetical protein [Terriglobales bacterium]